MAAHTPPLTLHHTDVPSPTAPPGSSCAGQTPIHGCPTQTVQEKGFQTETGHSRAVPVAAEQSLGVVQDSHGTGPSGSASLAVSVPRGSGVSFSAPAQ